MQQRKDHIEVEAVPERQWRIELANRMSVSAMEAFFDTLLRGHLSDNIFFNEMPTNIRKDWKEFVVVDCGNPMRDKDSYQVGTVLIFLYARQNSRGVKDVKTLYELECRLNALIESCEDEHYRISRKGVYSNYGAINDMFYNIVQVNLIVC